MKSLLSFLFVVLFSIDGFAQSQQSDTIVTPTVVTNPNYARGATVAFGRLTVSGALASTIKEQGFCWSKNPEPTILDNRTTKYYSNNGNIYCINNLEPSTVYYMRAYAITTTNAVGYGNVIKVITIPKGTVAYSMTANVTGDNLTRLTAAASSAVDYYNNATSIKGLRLTVNFGSGTPTAEASYGGYMTFGPNASYQRTGTALHEMSHTIGVGQHTYWTNTSGSPLRNASQWLGERALKVVRFLDNNNTSNVNADSQHFWPYGINGAQEDNGTEILYYANSLMVEAFGEDGLPPTNGFATPYYAFESEDTVKYYIKNEDTGMGRDVSFMIENTDGSIANRVMTSDDVLANDSAAWYFSFNPVNCYYTLKNVATGKYFTYSNNSISLVTKATPQTGEYFQIMGARIPTVIGAFNTKGYWIIHPVNTLNPPCLIGSTNGKIATATFNIANSATTQRWLILSADDFTKIKQLNTPEETSPAVKATPISSSWIKLEWDAAANAQSYRIYRASYPDSIYSIIKDSYTSTTYDDLTGLKPNTIYWYRVHSLNGGGESLHAAPVKVITKKIGGADGDDGLTSINQLETMSFTLYPNPVKARQPVFIQNEYPMEDIKIEMTDISGKTIRPYSNDNNLVAPPAKGLYFLKIIHNGKIKICKLLVE